ncbi:MAG: shikimate kinase [Phascolarctobacterium sp.]|nr:shikimate kinase [Phascolarctobacterium sp.]
MKNIVLIGMPGGGKSTFGKRLAKKLGRNFFDADDVLEEREQRTIKDFFAESEDAFRAAETRTLAYLAELEGVVIATGGGAVKRAENMQLMKKNGVIVFLDREPENILGSIEGDARPLLADDKQRIFKLYEERIELYQKYADKIIANNGDFGKTLALLEAYAKKIAE